MRLMLYHLTMAIKNWRTVRFTDMGRQTQPAVDAVVRVKEKPEQQPRGVGLPFWLHKQVGS